MLGAPPIPGAPSGPSHWCMSPRSAEIRADFPLPTVPTTTVSLPLRSSRLMSFRKGCSVGPGAVQWKYPPEMDATSASGSDMDSQRSRSIAGPRLEDPGLTDEPMSESSTSVNLIPPMDRRRFERTLTSSSSSSSCSTPPPFAATATAPARSVRSTSVGSSIVVAAASGSKKYFCRRRSATIASAQSDRHRG